MNVWRMLRACVDRQHPIGARVRGEDDIRADGDVLALLETRRVRTLYAEDESWVEDWAGDAAWEFPTPCEIAAPLELLFPDEGNLFDLENAIRMHKALPSLTPVQAQDPRLWTRLTHVELWEYMRARWPVEKYLEPEPNLSPIRDRYFVAVKPHSRSLVHNGASRLWWAAKMTCDPDRDNPYEFRFCFSARTGGRVC